MSPTLNRLERNKAFLTDLFSNRNYHRDAVVCRPPLARVWQMPGRDFCVSDRPVSDWVPIFVNWYYQCVEMHEKVDDDSVPFVFPETGSYIFAAAMGAPLHQPPESNACAIPYLTSPQDADRLTEPDIWKCPPLYRVFELCGLLEKELGKDVNLGVPDMQSGFDTLCMIWDKTDLFCSMIDEETKHSVHRLNGICASVFKKFTLEFRKQFPQASPTMIPRCWCPPEMGTWLVNDECGEISNETFEEYVLPELIDIAQTTGGLGMHCCAKAEHQFELFKKIPNWYGFNRVASPNTQGYEVLPGMFNEPTDPVLAFFGDMDVLSTMAALPSNGRYAFVLPCETVDIAQEKLALARDLLSRRVYPDRKIAPAPPARDPAPLAGA